MSWGACKDFGRAGNWGDGKVDLFAQVFGASRSGEVVIVVEGTNVITGHKCNKGHKCNNICSQM